MASRPARDTTQIPLTLRLDQSLQHRLLRLADLHYRTTTQEIRAALDHWCTVHENVPVPGDADVVGALAALGVEDTAARHAVTGISRELPLEDRIRQALDALPVAARQAMLRGSSAKRRS